MDNLVASFIWKDMRPFAVVEGEGFVGMVEGLNPSYKMKDRKTYTAIVKAQYEHAVEMLKSILADVPYIAITTDMWTSLRNDAYITVTAHWVTGDWLLETAVIATQEMKEAHSAENLSVRLSAITTEFGMTDEKIVGTVTDNGRNICKALELLDNWPELNCFAHTLQLCIKSGIDESVISRMRGAARHLVSHFKHSAKATTALREKQRRNDGPGGPQEARTLQLIMEVSTRWNSTYDMLERLDKLQWDVRGVLCDRNITKQRDASHLEMTDGNWTICHDLVKVLKPFKQVTTMMSASTYPSLASVYPVLFALKKKLEVNSRDSAAVQVFKIRVLEQIERRFFGGVWQLSMPMMAAGIDPRYKLLDFVPENLRNEAYAKLKQELADIGQSTTGENEQPQPVSIDRSGSPDSINSASSEDEDIFDILGRKSSQTLSATEQFDAFLRDPVLDQNADPLLWWKENRVRFEMVAQVARKYLCIPATSVPSESVFSAAGNIVSAKRSSLLPENVDMLIFMRKNSHLLKEF